MLTTPFDQLVTLINAQQPSADAADAVAMYHGDHWLGNRGYLGQLPELDAPGNEQARVSIEQSFVSENVIREVTDRHVGGVLGREPTWDYVSETPPVLDADGNPQRLLEQDEADAASTAWWDALHILQVLKGQRKRNQAGAIQYNLLGHGAVLRVYVPSGLREKYDQNGVTVCPDLTTALSIIRVRAYTEGCVVVEDSATEAPHGLFHFEQDGKQFIEHCYLDDDGATVLRRLNQQNEVVDETQPLQLGGHLLLHALDCPALITPQVIAAQKALNLSISKMLRNVNLAGDLEQILFNAEPPSKEVDDPDRPGFKKRVATKWRRGPGTTAFLQGAVVRDEDGKIVNRMSPSVSYRDPVSIDTFVGTRGSFYGSMLNQTHQTHVLMAGDAVTSGRAREQARAEYENSLKLTQEPVQAALRWLLEVTLRLAAQFCGQTARYAGLRAEVTVFTDSGPVSPEERAADREDYKAGGLSRETYMSRIGIDDIGAEQERIKNEAQELDPLATVDLERKKLSLSVDQAAAGREPVAAIAQRLEAGAASNGAV